MISWRLQVASHYVARNAADVNWDSTAAILQSENTVRQSEYISTYKIYRYGVTFLFIRDFKQRRFWATHVNRKWAFCTLEPWFEQTFGQIVSIRVQTLSHTNLRRQDILKEKKSLTWVAQKRCCLSYPMSFLGISNIYKEAYTSASSSKVAWGTEDLNFLASRKTSSCFCCSSAILAS